MESSEPEGGLTMPNSKDGKRPVEKIKKTCPSRKTYERISSNAAGEKTPDGLEGVKKEEYRANLEALVKERTAELTKIREVMKLRAIERNRAEQVLREIQREQSIVLENLSDLIVYRNRDMKTVWASKSMADWHGMTQEQIIGRVCYKARYGRNEPCEDCHIIEAMKSGKRRELEKQLPGGKCWHVIVNPAFDDSGRVVGTIEVSQDITEQKRSEEALKASEGKLNTMLQSISDHMSMMDKDLNILWANDVAKRRFGDDITGKKCYEVYHGRKSPCEPFPCLTLKAFQDSKVHEHDTQVIDKNGKSISFHCSANVALRDEQGKPTAVLEISKDITDQKLAEEALRESENSYRAVVENAAEGIVVVQDKTLKFVNPALVSMTGYSKEELLARSFIEFVHPDHRDWAMEIHIKRLKGEEVPPVYELKVIDKQGNVKLMENNGVLIEWCDKPATLNFLRDVTERKKAEQAIWTSESEKKSILNGISDHIIFHDTDLTIRWCNEAAARSVGMTQQDLVGQHCYELWQDRGDVCERCPVLAAIETVSQNVGIMTTPDGKWWEITGEPVFDRDGEIRGAIEISRDITERKEAERALQGSEELFRAIYENALVGLYRTTPDGRILMANPVLVQMMGYSSFEELAQLNVEEEGFALDCQRSAFKQRIEAEDQIVGLESRWMRRDGTTLFVRENARAVRNKDGEILYYEGTVADLTERKKAEEELGIREQKLRALLNAPTESAILIDTEGTIQDINRIAAQRLGKSVESLIGMGIYDFLPADIAEYRIAQGAEVVRSGKPVRFQDEHEGRYYDTNVYPVFDDEGKVSSLAVFSGDITERRQVEEALQESEERFRNLMEYIPEISIQGYNTEGTVRYWNKASEQVYGYTAEEAIGKNLGDLIIPEEIKPLFLKALEIGDKATVSGELLPAGEVILRRKDGSPVIVYSSHTVVCIEGKETLMFCLDLDLSERKRDEEMLRESEERLKILFESAPDAIYLIDSEGRFMDANKAALEMVGFAKDEVIGKSLAEMGLLSDVQLSKAKENLKSVIDNTRSGPNEYDIKRKDGTYISVEVRTFPVKIAGKILTLGIARDITEHKQTEKKLLEHQAKLKSLASQLSLTEERERHRLATDLHDQISQSLVISKIKLDQLRKSSTSDAFYEPLGDISNCLGRIIDDTRALTFDLSYPILYELGFEAAVAEWLTDQIQEEHGIKTEFEDDGRKKPLDDDIRVLLFRNVRELLINVVKHAQANKVKVSIRKIKNHISVSVEDNGVGFDPVEVESLTAKKAEFGLFSIRERLEQLGGLIEIDSKMGRGTKITMTAPLKCGDVADGA